MRDTTNSFAGWLRAIPFRQYIQITLAILLLAAALMLPVIQRTHAATQQLVLAPEADTHVQNSFNTTNFGKATELTGSSSDARALLRWNTTNQLPAGATLTGAKLRLYVTNIQVTSPGVVVHPALNTWDEYTVTWNTQPTWNSSVLATSGSAVKNSWVEVDLPVSSIKAADATSFAIRYSASGSYFRFNSRETANKPQLVLTYEEAAPDPEPQPTSGDLNFTPTEDAFARGSEPSTNFATSSELSASSADNRAFMRFGTSGAAVPTGTQVTSATLRIYTTNIAVTSGGFEAHPASTAWTEATLTWNNQPTWNTQVLATSATPLDERWIDISLPVSSITTSSDTNLAVRYTVSGSLSRFASRESTNKPQLILHYDPIATNPIPTTYPTLMAAGDVACRPGMSPTSTTCQHAAVANLISNANPDVVAALGDLQYDTGTLTEFQGSYDQSWGLFKIRTKPTPGNHEYTDAAGNAKGYYDYFNGVGIQTGLAGDRSKGYYSYNVGDWHVVVLNSECWYVGGCDPSSAQYAWLQQDLSSNNAACTLAYWHKPRFTNSSDYSGETSLGAMWNLMVGDVDVVLAGHTHTVEVFKKIGITPTTSNTPVLSPTGIKQFVIGSGGRSHHAFSTTPLLASDGNAAVEARDNTTFGALRMTLKPTGYDWEMQSIPGQTFHNADTQTTGAFSGSEICN